MKIHETFKEKRSPFSWLRNALEKWSRVWWRQGLLINLCGLVTFPSYRLGNNDDREENYHESSNTVSNVDRMCTEEKIKRVQWVNYISFKVQFPMLIKPLERRLRQRFLPRIIIIDYWFMLVYIFRTFRIFGMFEENIRRNYTLHLHFVVSTFPLLFNLDYCHWFYWTDRFFLSNFETICC